MKLQPYDEPRYSLGIGLSSDDVVGSHRRFARRFTERIGKLAGKAKGDRWKKTGGLVARLLEYVGVELNQLTKELVNVKVKPKFEK
ncbi:hypothetical protein B296_00034836 [Ensete ventricosum]|uniref:Uncharacterized protein n=1 Tax=Ensete ventricosum TaxID=4639 RepID=A0A426XAJ7_ENSVE|nr:hypothetical protein B296_00034836 [Ensete ventricosum]